MISKVINNERKYDDDIEWILLRRYTGFIRNKHDVYLLYLNIDKDQL